MDRVKVGLKKRGAALALVVVSLAIILVMGATLLTLGWNARVLAIRTEADIAARCAADSGLTKVIAVMNVNPISYLSNPPPQQLDFIEIEGSEPSAIYNYQVFAWSSGANLGTVSRWEYLVKSTGRCNAAQRIIWGRLKLRGVGEPGILVRDTITLMAGTVVDGRDSRLPKDDPGQLSLTTQIGTSSKEYDPSTGIYFSPKIELKNGVYVDGDVLVGFGGDPNSGIFTPGGGAIVTGYKGSLDEEPEFPPVTPPALPNYEPQKISKKGGGELDPLVITAANSGVYSMIDLQTQAVRTGQEGEGEPAILIVASGDVVLHLTNTGTGEGNASISLGRSCEIRIMPGASLNLYVDGNISSGTESGFNNLGTPPDLKLWGLAHDPLSQTPLQDWQLNAKSQFFGQVYAPEATLTVKNEGEEGKLYGSFTAYSLTMMNSGSIFYDEALRIPNPNDPGVRFMLKRWWEE